MTDILKPGPVCVDVEGLSLSEHERNRLRHPLTGMVILFSRNYGDPAQLRALCEQIHAVRPGILISVDHEGGRVQRFRSGFTEVPAMSDIASGVDAERRFEAAGLVLAAELRACGVDFTFAPVLDVDHGRSAVIGTRSLGKTPELVTAHASALIRGLRRGGMASCGKHFPGHGWAEADSHVAVPTDERTLETILTDDARPYEWLSTSLTSVMPAHVIYPQVDARPAGYSSRWLNTVLREQLGFTGVIFSDDLSMEGARRVPGVKDGAVLSYTEAATLALSAGCDMVLLCNQSLDGGRAVDELLDGLQAALERGEWRQSPDSEERRLALLPQTPPLTWDELMHDAPYRRALQRLEPLL